MPLKKRHNDLLNGYEGQHPTVAAVKMSREIFSFEEPGGGILYLAGGVSRNWLTRGDPVAASNLATRYGTVSYSLTYEAENRTLTIDLDLEGDTTIPELRIAVRDPMDLGASSVSSSTGQTCTLKGSWVILTDVTESQTLTVIYP